MKGDNHYYVYQDSFLNSKFIILLPLKLTADSIEESCYTQSIGLFPSFSVGSEIKNIKLRSKTKNTCDIYMVKSNDILKDLGQRTYESFSDSHSMLHTIDYFGTGVIMRNQFFYSTYSSFDTLNSRILLSQFCLNLSKKTFYLLNINVSLGKEDKEVYFENNLSFLIKKVGNSQ
ncbi:MAG: hypothetical protein IPH93_14225 [Saprospiraceae bacterium]|nr:hypothetical protein [Saprospiraceae bacterium]MBK7812526.1 hypothetical protein [Saprospiraceae bacterium]